MLYILKMVDYLKILTDGEVKDPVAKNFAEYFKFITVEQDLRNRFLSF